MGEAETSAEWGKKIIIIKASPPVTKRERERERTKKMGERKKKWES